MTTERTSTINALTALLRVTDLGTDRVRQRATSPICLPVSGSRPETRAYVERRSAEGRTTKEIRRCIKRYLARQLYRTLEALHAAPDITPQTA